MKDKISMNEWLKIFVLIVIVVFIGLVLFYYKDNTKDQSMVGIMQGKWRCMEYEYITYYVPVEQAPLFVNLYSSDDVLDSGCYDSYEDGGCKMYWFDIKESCKPGKEVWTK